MLIPLKCQFHYTAVSSMRQSFWRYRAVNSLLFASMNHTKNPKLNLLHKKMSYFTLASEFQIKQITLHLCSSFTSRMLYITWRKRQPSVLGLRVKIFIAGGAAGVTSVRRNHRLPPRQTEPLPASSEMDPPLAIAEPVRDTGGTS